jgi:dipeptidyl aminopeptidase/acylaminoacyl peptidase
MSRSLISWSVLALVACGGGSPPTTHPVPPAGDPVTSTPHAQPPAPIVPAGTPGKDLIDRKILFGNPERASVQISPDGKYLSWTAPKDGVMNVFVAEVGKLDQARPVTSDTTRPVRAYFWTYDKQHLLYLQDVGGNENFHVHRVSVGDGVVTDLTPGDDVRAQVIGVSHRKPGIVLLGLNDRDPKVHDVWRFELASGNKTRLVENTEGFVGWLVDDNLDVRFAMKVLPDGSQAMYQQDKRGGWTEYLQVPATDSISPLGFTKRGDQLYVTDNRQSDTQALYTLDVKTKKQKLILADARADIGRVMFHPTENTPIAASVEYDRDRLVVLDKRAKPDFDGMAKLGEGDVFVVSNTLDDKTWVVALNGDRQPTRYFLWNRGKKQGTFLFATRPDLEGQPLVKQHPVVIESRDGLGLVSYLSLPKAADPDEDGKADQPAPTVLLVHGGPWARDRWGFNALHQLLANRGYAVLSVNFRGSTGFGKNFLNAGNGEWGKKMHDDLLDATAWLVAQGIAPKDKVCIMGGSYGGYATLAGLTLTPDAFACGVDIVGPSNIITLLESIPPYWAPILGMFKFRIGDWSQPEIKQALLEVSPLTHVAKIKRPLLIGQGANDPRVKQAESDQIVKAMQAKRIPVSYVLFPDEGHGFARPENSLAFFAAAEAFLSAHLGGVYQPITKGELAGSSIQIVTGKESIPGWP